MDAWDYRGYTLIDSDGIVDIYFGVPILSNFVDSLRGPARRAYAEELIDEWLVGQ